MSTKQKVRANDKSVAGGNGKKKTPVIVKPPSPFPEGTEKESLPYELV